MTPVVAIEVKEVKEVTIPSRWHTATECRARAESWENDELRACVDTVLASMWEIAGQGGVSGCHKIRTGRPDHFYKTFTQMMETLGYKVEAPVNPADTYYNSKVWTFRW
jgi:hypothetical protein